MALLDKGSTITLHQMIDLAIGTPEVGVVDFNVLHALLHCLVHQVRIGEKPVDVSSLSIGGSLPAIEKTVSVHEFALDPQGTKMTEIPKPEATPDTILVVDKKQSRKDAEAAAGAPGKGTPAMTAAAAAAAIAGGTGASSGAPGELRSLVTVSKFNLLSETVEDLRNKIYGNLPQSGDIIKAVRTASNEKAVSDMWSTLNVQGRLDAVENGVGKLSSVIEELILQTPEHQNLAGRLTSIKNQMVQTGTPGQAGAGGFAGAGQAGAPGQAGPGGFAGQAGPGGFSGQSGPGGVAVQAGPGGFTGQAGPGGFAGQAGPGGFAGQAGPGGFDGQAGPGGFAGQAGPGGFAGQAGPGGFAGQAGPGDFAGQAGPDGFAGQAGPGGFAGQAGPGGFPGQAGPGGFAGQAGPGGFAGQAGPGGFAGQAGPGGFPGQGGPGGFPGQAGPGGFGVAGGVFTRPQEIADMSDGDIDTIIKNIQSLHNDLNNLSQQVNSLTAASGPAGFGGMGFGGMGAGGWVGSPQAAAAAQTDMCDRLNQLDTRICQCCNDVKRNNNSLVAKMSDLEDSVDYLLKQMGINTDDIEHTKRDKAALMTTTQDLQGLMDLFQTVQNMQQQLQRVHETATHLANEKEQRQHNMNNLLEQIELLKVVKMDREDMAEAMAEKADIHMLAKKVSHGQFEMACDDLSKGLELAIGKLNMQEALWQQALDDIQREIEAKLDKVELGPVKEFFFNKLKMLQENLKQLAQLKSEVEAAGTKKKLLRDVNCISCDAKTVMPMEAGASMPVQKPLNATHSMKPYLTYELDAIRKSRSTQAAGSRNMHDWETIDKQMTQAKPVKVRSDTDKHLCNRYCGGSHTMTTPAQRVARSGHFIKQWGPDVVPLSSTLAAGDDGKMYRVNPDVPPPPPPPPADICTPKNAKRIAIETKPPTRQMIISHECRCLEGGDKDGPKTDAPGPKK